VIKAIFFDWFNTLAHYDPPREELQSQALLEFGIEVPPQKIIPALAIADRDYFEENAISPVRQRQPEEQAQVYARYQQTILTEAGVKISQEPDLLVKIMKKAQELAKGMRFVLFGDVLDTLKVLQERNLTLGILTNLDSDVQSICRELGLEPYIDFIVTSGEVGADKPKPPIFQAALEKASIAAVEALHVGDQYKVDIVGARGVGINPVLIDRNDLYPEISDCPRINNLSGLVKIL
jgi:HAD superfamily hydrolase (TIGR01549 family)